MSQNRFALVREDDFVELFEKVFLQTFEQIEYIPIIEIKNIFVLCEISNFFSEINII